MTQYWACGTDLEPGTAKQIEIDTPAGKLVLAIVRDIRGDWYAIDDTCTHADISLSEGEIGEKTIECWGHCAQFNLETGEGEIPAPAPVNVYPLSIEGTQVLVEVD